MHPIVEVIFEMKNKTCKIRYVAVSGKQLTKKVHIAIHTGL